MAIPTLTEEQVQTWTREQKDRWWLEKVYRGSMPQLTLRSALTGFLLGGLLSATNLYVGAKTGWTLGVGLTSVILAFAMFKALTRLGAKDMTILENNAMQSVATAAGYMTGPLISGMTAYMWVQNEVMNWWHMMSFNVVLSILGVLVAFPMKRRFINDEQQPFPEGRACGVVLDTLYTSEASIGIFKAKALGISAVVAGLLAFLTTASYFYSIKALGLWIGSGKAWGEVVKERAKEILATFHIPHDLGAWMDANKVSYFGIQVKQLGVVPAVDIAMIGAGGLMGFRAACNLMAGMLINFFVVVPWMIRIGEIKPKSGTLEAGTAIFGRVHVLNTWALWWGIVMMVTASMVALFAKPKVFTEAFGKLLGKKKDAPSADVLGHIELPLKVSLIGVPIVGALGVWMAHDFFGVDWVYGATAIPMIIVLTLIAASSTALTGTTPTGSLSKIPQFTYGALDPKHPPTNLMTGVMCVEVASNASNLLMDIKPGYMLGAKPRQQAIGHCIGVISGALASTPLFYALFVPKGYEKGQNLQAAMTPEGASFGFPSAVQWKGVSDLVTSIFGGSGSGSLLTNSIIWSMVIAGVAALVFEVARVLTKGKFPIMPLAIGLGVVVPADSTMMMFLGALFFEVMHRVYGSRKESTGHKLWVGTHEPICAGIVAGAAIVGILGVLLQVFALDGLK